MSPELKKLMEENVEAVEEFKRHHLKKVEELDKDVSELDEDSKQLFERVEMLEAKASNPSLSVVGGANREQHEHKKLFTDWVRKPRGAEENRKLSEFESHETKALSRKCFGRRLCRS